LASRDDVYLIGLTGNIGVGKSTVDAMLAAKGAAVLDADRVVHDLQRNGEPVWRGIVDRFGAAILRQDGELDRAKLGQLVFADPSALADLEAIVHPAVHEEEFRRIREAPSGSVLVLDAVKLIESGMAANCHTLWVVTAPSEQQVARLKAQRGMTEEAAWQRIQAQPPQPEKVAKADVVIDNSRDLAQTEAQVHEAWQRTVVPWQRQAER
jgi:dephospho-CoA kinase